MSLHNVLDSDWPCQKLGLFKGFSLIEEIRLSTLTVSVVHLGESGSGSVLDFTRFSCVNNLLRVSSSVLRLLKNIRWKLNNIERQF